MKKVCLNDLPTLARRVLEALPPQGARASIVALVGDLGAGKTTFVQALARELGVVEQVQSPTYVLMKSYPIRWHGYERLVHIDAYRLEGAEQFAALKPAEFLEDPKALVVIEWPERIEGALPAPDLMLTFSSQDASEGERYIEGI